MFKPLACLLAFAAGIGPAHADISDPVPKDWMLAMKRQRAEVGLPDIGQSLGKKTGSWRFTYMLSLALDTPQIVTVEEQPDGTAKILVTTENPVFQNYRVNEYDRHWICGLQQDEQTFVPCPAPYPIPTGEQYRTEVLVASRDDIIRLRTLVSAVPICEEPMGPHSASVGYDGSDWIFEAADGGHYCMAYRWSPSANTDDPNGEAFQQLGIYFALLAQGKVFPM